jgi:hypothetical protein
LFSPAYSLLANSPTNKRGTGILVKNSINFTVLKEYKDDIGNIMGIHISMDNKVLVIVSIYGPNNNDDNFFVDLRNVLHDNINFPVLIGGDWNLKLCTDPNDRNIDIINMRSPPPPVSTGLGCWQNSVSSSSYQIHFELYTHFKRTSPTSLVPAKTTGHILIFFNLRYTAIISK